MGGVFNYINLHAYHYAGNNPVKHTDPTGAYDFDHENKIIYTDLTIKDLDAANTIFAGYQQFGYKVVALDDEGKAFLDLDGFGWSTGGSAGEGVYVGGDINLGKYPGGSFSFGLTARVPAEGHSGPSVFFVYPKDK
jgi:hypothetical protein